MSIQNVLHSLELNFRNHELSLVIKSLLHKLNTSFIHTEMFNIENPTFAKTFVLE